jgi:uncharacterized repeat protein (TIGR01451 family)
MRKVFTILFSGLSLAAAALNPLHFTITRITAPYFVVDGNSTSTITKAYVGFEVKNNSNSATTYSNLKFTITSIGTSVVGQNYSLVSPANGIINVGTLAPGESRICYYYVAYPANTTAQGTFNVQLSDNTVTWKTTSFIIINRSSISANAGGTATQTFTNQDLIGGLIYDDVTYAVGNVQNADESDFQVAVSTQFDPTKILLLGTQVTASTVPGISVGATDSLYFITGNGSNGASITIRWTFKISATNFTTYLLPCAGATSGSTNYKYALNTALGQGTPVTISSAANPLTISKSSDKTVYGANATAVFTVTISNPGIYGISIDKITDEIPAGFSFLSMDASSQVTATNATTMPSVGATGTVTFDGGVSSGSNTSFYVPAGGSIILKYKATAPALPAANLLTTARDYVGTTQVGSATNTVGVSLTLPVSLLSFSGTIGGADIRLNWATSSEHNTAYTVIERAYSNSGFTRVGEVAAAGFSTVVRNYSFADVSVPAGPVSYRLRMVDQDGRYTYSPVLLFKRSQPAFDLNAVYPNPFKDRINISYDAKHNETVTVRVLDISGKLVASQIATSVVGINYLSVNGGQLKSGGTYLLQLVSSEGIQQKWLVKNN